MFKIKDLEFVVSEAFLKGHLSETLKWSISIHSFFPKGRIQGEQWEPHAYSQNLLGLKDLQVDEWREILNAPLRWNECYDSARETENASLYIFEHNDIYSSEMQFNNVGSSKFELTWKARCDVFFDETYAENLDLHIQTDVLFAGIETSIRDENLARNLLEKYIRKEKFHFHVSEEENVLPIFIPSLGLAHES